MANRSSSGSHETTANRGFASMEPGRRRDIARKGGVSVPPEKRSFSQNRELASEAGQKGAAARARPGDTNLHRAKPDEDRQSQLDAGHRDDTGTDEDILKDAKRRVREGAVDDTGFGSGFHEGGIDEEDRNAGVRKPYRRGVKE